MLLAEHLTYEVNEDLETALKARRPEARAKVIEDILAGEV